MTKLSIFGKLDFMDPKIITPSWSKSSLVKFKFFPLDSTIKNPREHTRNQLLSLLELDKAQTSELQNHDYFDLKPDWKVSLSHAPEAGCVCGIKGDKVLGIGVDLEKQSRNIPHKSRKFFKNFKDQSDLDLLTLWTKKEAAFKAYAPHHSKLKILNHLWIQGNAFGDIDSKNPRGEVYTVLHNEHIISYAYLMA